MLLGVEAGVVGSGRGRATVASMVWEEIGPVYGIAGVCVLTWAGGAA
jgi:hypothetical protein